MSIKAASEIVRPKDWVVTLRYKVALSLFMLLLAPASLAKDDVLGYWASSNSILQITNESGRLSATVVALLDPTYRPDEQGKPTGANRLDDNNPDSSLQTKPLIGLELFKNYTHSGKRWEGKIYDPESGKTYSSRIHVDRAGNLRMRGYIGTPMLGRTATFAPLSQCTDNMKVMLSRSKAAIDCKNL